MIAAINLIATEFVILSLVCGALIHHYKSPLVTPDVTASVYISWVLGFAAVLLLPYDLSLALVSGNQNESLVHLWAWVYWSTFFLAWLVLPVQMEYHNSGHFSFKDKLIDALKRLLFAAVAAMVGGFIYIVYMVSTSGGSFSQVLAFMMAMGNTYGVLLITVLMGSGLVSLPKRLWAMSDSQEELRRLYLLAGSIEDAYQEARYELEDCELEVKKVGEMLEKAGPNSELYQAIGEFAEILKNKVANFTFAGRSSSRAYGKNHPTLNTQYLTKSEMVALHQRLITAQLKARASEQRWRHLVKECKIYQDAMNNEDFSSEDDSGLWCLMPVDTATQRQSSDNGVTSCLRSVTLSLRSCYLVIHKLWITKCYSVSLKALSIICGICSILILWSEMLMASNLHSPIGYMMGAYNTDHIDPTVVQAISFVALAYMSISTYWTLFRMNIGWSYRLQAPNLSPPSSLIFNGEYLSRLQFSLGYNFLLCLNDRRTSDAAFSSLMDNIEIIPVFGTSFTTYVPIIMIMIALITLFDGFARILKMLGVETEDALTPTNGFCGFFRRREDEMDTELLEKCKSGKMIVANELKQLAIAHEALRKNRAAIDTRREQSQAEVQAANTSGKSKTSSHHSAVTSSSSSSSATADSGNGTGKSGSTGFLSTWKDSVAAKVGLGGAKYSNLEVTKPHSILEDEDEDEESVYFDRTSSRHSKSSFAQREDDLGESIFTATLSANIERNTASNNRSSSASASSGLFNTNKATGRNPPLTATTRAPSFLNTSKSSSTTTAVTKNATKPKNFFDFDDDDDSSNNIHGRYSDV